MTGTRIEQSVPWDRYPVPNTPIPKPNIEALTAPPEAVEAVC